MRIPQTLHIGLTRLVPDLRGGRWLCGAAIFLGLVTFFAASGVFAPGLEGRISGNGSAALFFSVVLAYIVPVFHYISARTVEAIDQLAPDLDSDPASVARIRAHVERKERTWFAMVIAIGLAAAIAHNLVLAADEDVAASARIAWLSMVLGTTMAWVVLTFVIAALIDNARLLNRLARGVALNPFAAERLRPFATIAVLSTLAIIGVQAAFPIMILDAKIHTLAFLPGLIATSIPMLLLAILPIWPLHTRLRTAKLALLDEANAQIARNPVPGPGEQEALEGLLPLLAYRREIQGLAEWPLDLGTVGRFVVYLIIPPLTWIGAALIENVVDSVM